MIGTRRLGSLAAVAALLATTIGAGPAAATVSPVTMDITIGNNCVGGDKPISSALTLTLKHADGTVIETKGDATPFPNFSVCFTHQVHVGYKLRADWDGSHRQVDRPGPDHRGRSHHGCGQRPWAGGRETSWSRTPTVA